MAVRENSTIKIATTNNGHDFPFLFIETSKKLARTGGRDYILLLVGQQLFTNSSTATATVALTFNHQLSAITIVIKKADDIKEPLILQKVELVNYPSSIHMNIQTGRLTASNTVADYPIPLAAPITITPAEATVSTNYLLWPGEAPTFRFSISDHTYEVHPSQAFIAGKKQKYTFTIQAEDINVGASINPWTEGPEGSGEIGI